MPGYRVGVDIGGTFTDAVLMDMETGDIHRSKVPTTPKDLSEGFVTSIKRVLSGERSSYLDQIVHATTVATNAIIEGKVARGAFITTKGFRDILEIQRQIRSRLYDIFFDKPKPLVQRGFCFEVEERISPEGTVMAELNEKETEEIAHKLKELQVESVAICFLHSYLNPEHEIKAGKIILEKYPDIYLTLSSELAPQFREYARASTAVINAVIMPIVARYLEKLEQKISGMGIRSGVYVMQSSGGLMTADTAKVKPAYMVESGPAAGVIAASSMGQSLGYYNLISFDMGGTTAKVSLIENGQPKLTLNYEVGAIATPESGVTKGSGYPLKTPVIDLVEIGAGGGSIAWIDSGGVLRVGPQSAGADPGPACYGKGGSQPTITDADLILGRIDAQYFLGGEIKLSREKAELAVQRDCSDALGIEVTSAAMGIIEIANANMLRAMRLVSIERGYDPREFALIAFGGAGPMHANDLAAELKIPNIIVPVSPGLFSAMGLLITDLKHEYIKTFVSEMSKLDLEKVNALYKSLEEEGLKLLKLEGIGRENVTINRAMDLRYIGQSYELTLPIPNIELKSEDMLKITEKFHEFHEQSYGHSAKEEPVELVNLRVTTTGRIAKPKLKELKSGDKSPEGAVRSKRKVYFKESDGFVETYSYFRHKLEWGNIIEGPAIVEDPDATTVIHPGYKAEVLKTGELLISAT